MWRLAAKIPVRLSEDLEVLGVLFPTPYREAGPGAGLQYAESFADLPFSVLHNHQRQVGDIGLECAIGEWQAHIVSHTPVDKLVVRTVLVDDSFEIYTLLVCDISVVCLCIDNNLVAS